MKNKILVWCGLVMFFICTSVSAEVVYLNSGTEIEGDIVSQDNDKVVVRIGGEEGVDVTLFSYEIQRIEKERLPQADAATTAVKSESSLPQETPRSVTSSSHTSSSYASPSHASPSHTSSSHLEEAKQEFSESKQEQVEPVKVQAESITQTEEERTGKLEADKCVVEKSLPKTQMTVVPKVNMVVDSAPAKAPQEPQTIEEIMSQPAQQEALEKGAAILNELTELLDEEELKYFMELNSSANEVVNRIMQVVVNPASVSNNPAKLMQAMQDLSTETASLIDKMSSVQPPPAFANFHSYYLTNLGLLRDVLVDMSKGNANALQAKVAQLQEIDTKIQQELSNILVQKKNKANNETDNVAN